MARLFAASAIAWTFAIPAHAQLTRGAITGTVSDPTGAAIPGARVTVTNLDTRQRRATVTNTVGLYRLPALEPGRYTVHVDMTGFASVESTDVEVRTSQEVTIDFALKVSAQSETIDVTSETETVLLNKTNPTIGYTLTAR
jgi:hypothetical protein